MSSIELDIPNKTDELDSKVQKFDSEIKKSLRVSCRENFNEYLLGSSLHGLRYVGDRTISRFERAFFALMFFMVILLSIYFISNVWEKWNGSPIIITLNSKSTSIKDIPFPAVTVCNMNQVMKSAIQNISRDSADFAIIKGLCKQEFLSENETSENAGTWDVIKTMLLKVAPTCQDTILYCEYGGVKFDCSSRFSMTLTDDGICCVFNAVPKIYLITEPFEGFEAFNGNSSFTDKEHLWTPERGYTWQESLSNEEKYPSPGVASGNEMGLSLILKANIDDYFCSSTRSFGFKILLHSPNDFPKIAHYGVSIPTHYESRIAVQPTLSIASQSIRRTAVETRQCLFEDENFLTFYSTYSDKNCQIECDTKLLYKHCGCILYYQPQAYRNISICGTADLKCLRRVTREIQIKRRPSFRCRHCLTGCFAINYDSTFSTAKIFDRLPFLSKLNLDPKDISIVHIYYSRSTFRAQKKDELVGFTDFLSGIGGLLGLFMGFSVISVIEMFYFISIRPYCNYLRFSNKRRELMMRIIRRIDKLRQRKRNSFIIKTVETNSTLDDNYRQHYLD